MELSKAFDTVFHEILLQKRYHYGICEPVHKTLKSYLSSRQQLVSCNLIFSSSKYINIGVPQRSIFLILHYFLFYINDFSNKNIFKPRLFADDTRLI